MLLAKRVNPEWRDKVPAIVHIDCTARVQTIRREHNERLYLLLKEFEDLTGVPVLLNTSFNIRGEPIVETPADAMKCFLNTGIDYLVMHDILVSKNRSHRYFYPIVKWGSDVATMVKVGTAADLRGEED
jgi:carbamoyltransferase